MKKGYGLGSHLWVGWPAWAASEDPFGEVNGDGQGDGQGGVRTA